MARRRIKWGGRLCLAVYVYRLLTAGNEMIWDGLLANYRRDGLRGLKRGLYQVFTSGQCKPAYPPVGIALDNYVEWIRLYDTLSAKEANDIRVSVDSLGHTPKISVVIFISDPCVEHLVETIGSVRNQTYSCWELCLIECVPLQESFSQILKQYAARDSRIKVSCFVSDRATSKDLSALISGEWVTFLGHEDLLAEQALFHVAVADSLIPDLGIIYSDEDQVDALGTRSNPYFKCDWNADLFYSQNFIGHLSVFRSRLLHDCGSLRQSFDDPAVYDLALCSIEQLERDQIHHIPRVLYHSRIRAEHVTPSKDARLLRECALNEHFQRQGVKALAKVQDSGTYRVCYTLPVNSPLVSLIVPTRNGLQLLRQCIDSIVDKTSYPNYEIMIVDNSSDDLGTLEYLKSLESQPRCRVLRDARSFNYSALNNAAVKLARGDLVGLVNNDVEVIAEEWLSEMVGHALRPEVGAVGARIWYPDGTLQHGGVVLGIGGVAGHAHKHLSHGVHGYFGRASATQEFCAVTAACLVIRKATYEEVGGLNETDLKIAFNDIDFCLRVREAGYINVWTPYAELYHHESATRGAENTLLKRLRFAREMRFMNRRWGDLLQNDPAYSPNLSLDRHDFSYAWPPRTKPLVTSFDGNKRW
jgi:GT2 family glycosyltransferase